MKNEGQRLYHIYEILIREIIADLKLTDRVVVHSTSKSQVIN